MSTILPDPCPVILSEVGVREADAHAVEGPLVRVLVRDVSGNSPRAPLAEMPFRIDPGASGRGVLRLRGCFAKLSSYSTQEDRAWVELRV